MVVENITFFMAKYTCIYYALFGKTQQKKMELLKEN